MTSRLEKTSINHDKPPFAPYLVPAQAPEMQQIKQAQQTDLFIKTVTIDSDGIHATDFVRSKVEGLLQDQLTRISPDLKTDAPIPRWAAHLLRRSILEDLNGMNIRVDLLNDTLSLGHGPNDDEHYSLGKEKRRYRKVVKN